MECMQECEAIYPVQPRKEGARLRAFFERGCKILGDVSRALRGVGLVPTPVTFRPLDLAHACRPHSPESCELKRPRAVLRRPEAGRLARSEADQPVVFVERIELAVDPAMAKRR